MLTGIQGGELAIYWPDISAMQRHESPAINKPDPKAEMSLPSQTVISVHRIGHIFAKETPTEILQLIRTQQDQEYA
jgi:hypothetical protein